MLNWALAALIGYLLGSVPVGFLVGKVRGIDVRNYGSGATGGTNVLRTMGVGPALLTGLTDAAKGVLGAYIGSLLAGDVGYALGGLLSVVGHSYPVWLNFKGGKSVATGGGSLLLASPVGFGLGLVGLVGTAAITRYVSLGSLVGALFLGTYVVLDPGVTLAIKLHALGAVAVVYIRHWENIKRLLAGTENKLGQKARPRAEQ